MRAFEFSQTPISCQLHGYNPNVPPAPEDCVVDLGTMILLGPTGTDFATCVRGRSCSATITGTYLSTSDTIFASKECAGRFESRYEFFSADRACGL